ncbi:MAG: hypothetical protein QXL98_01360 [Thermofilaceae archaeon]
MGRRKEIPLDYGVKAKLALLWQNNTNEWKRYHEIRNHLKSFPEFKKISERTIIRYINQLCTEGFLEKRIELTHRTWYKPREAILVRKEALKQAIEALNDEHVIESVEKLLMKKSNEKQRGGE